MNFLDKTKNLPYELEFNKRTIDLVRFNSNYDLVKANHNKDLKTLTFFYELDLKRNDKLIDNHDNIYFVQKIDIDSKLAIKNPITGNEKEFTVETVYYDFKEVEIPNSIKQSIKIETSINIDANNSNFNGGLANYNISQTASYPEIFDFMKILINNTYHVKELRILISEIENTIRLKQQINEKWYKKFYKFMGTKLLDIAAQFLAAYCASLATK